MNILLIQPKAYTHRPTHVSEPLNLGYLASYLKSKGFNRVDIKVGAFESDRTIIQKAKETDIVGFTATSPMMTHGLQLAKRIKEYNRNVIVVCGGSHPAVAAESVLKKECIDIVVRGEGEVTFYELVKAIQEHHNLQDINGISYKQKETIIHNPDREVIKDIDTIPFPARHLFNQERFIQRFLYDRGKRLRSARVLASRGCPFRCSYCASFRIWTRRWRVRSAENVIKEIEELVDTYKIEHINFSDDTFTVNKKWVKEFCRLLKEKDIDITWACNVQASTIDRELLYIMKESGCIEVWIGVESGSPVILKEIKKNLKVNEIINAFDWAKEVGLQRHAYFMVGSPSESRETIHQSENLIERIKPDFLAFTIFTPYPGCEAYEEAKRKGYVKDDMDWSLVDLHSTVSQPTKSLTKYEILKEHRRISLKFIQYCRLKDMSLRILFLKTLSKLRTSSFSEWLPLAKKVLVYTKAQFLRRLRLRKMRKRYTVSR